MDATTLFGGVILGSLGMGYIVYGRKQKKGIALLSGIVLCGLPCFVSNIYFLLIAGIAFAALPFLVPY
jgi:hypothetical protein